ncbi:SH3 domain-containing protein [Microlunatus antarcticus]|uniref:SH3b domain-containing protein n=1 Tax=Microlunatus antarcticus TaxID=53388 RepID=A0A7W5JYZ7_9ACTN|nr:SH3 domain-containing protein [Microlunatus antarcticus]MBB3328904.1 hypothetical protein [Microlunatus antarcticus]
MPRPRPRRALRPSAAVRAARIAVPLALVGLGTSGVVAFALPGSDAQTAVPAPASSAPAVDTAVREQPVSRDLGRTASPTPLASATPTAPSATPTTKPAVAKPSKRAEPTADDLAERAKASRTMWATDDLDIRADPDKKSDVVAEVDPGTKLAATTTVRDGFRLVVFKGEGRWVTAKYVSKDKPDPAKTGGVTDAPCSKGSGMESGLTPDAVLVHRTVCARFPQVTSFGGTRGGGGFHGSGQAVDCMISDAKVGRELADWVRAHARELGVSEVIYAQHIWTVQRGSEGWRSMSDRGSKTANHYDHVHVSVYGNRAS